jgi:uncharacterized membrane protein
LNPEIEGEKETARVEAFSDGVFAIAITLLILEVKVPREGTGPLGAQLIKQWPQYVGFLTSFIFIGVMWMNHHKIFTLVRKTDHMLLVWNTLLLLGVTATPFTTAVVAEHLLGQDATTALLVYNIFFFGVAIMYTLLWRHARKFIPARFEKQKGLIDAQYRFGGPLYLMCALAALVSPFLSLGLDFALAVFFALPYGASRD